MSGIFVGVDTSCYTTSIACVNEEGVIRDDRVMLSVRLGERGLRQSDGLFQHVRNLGTLAPQTLDAIDTRDIRAVCVSARPRPNEDSYMPVFLAGKNIAVTLASALRMPLVESSHQAGHVRAALYENEDYFGAEPFLGLHISGGTTEIFRSSAKLDIELLGGTEDLHAGQFVDRTGVALGLGFPAGKHMEKLVTDTFDVGSLAESVRIKLPSVVHGLKCSFSGVETRVQRLIEEGEDKADVALAVYDCVARTVAKLIVNAAEETGLKRALLAGGVASSAILRGMLKKRLASTDIRMRFARPELSSDNAVGLALIARDAYGARCENGECDA